MFKLFSDSLVFFLTHEKFNNLHYQKKDNHVASVKKYIGDIAAEMKKNKTPPKSQQKNLQKDGNINLLK